jgi:hypothetical protein
MGKAPKEIKSPEEFLKRLQDAAEAYFSYQKDYCTSETKAGACADQELEFDKMCKNCQNAWTKMGSLGGQTAQEALEFIRKKRKNYEEVKELLLKPCSKENIYGQCSDQGIPFADMCENCKNYWTKAALFDGMTPEKAIDFAHKSMMKRMERMLNERPSN